jgi:bifunctional DNA-binding transcriptional regulator/antitoxin component of YhaV-PrlF toxin-antitoxin module
MKVRKETGSATTYSMVGNIGCIRFPPEIRKSSGIKRGDRLSVEVSGGHRIILQKLGFADWVGSAALSVDGCTCQQAPQGCAGGKPHVVTVGWSYVKLGEELAQELGFLPDAPLKLVGEPSRITVSVHNDVHDLVGIKRLPCPP